MYKTIKLNLARNSLKYVIRVYQINQIYIPYYLCDVIRQSIIKEKCKPVFYHIDNNFYPMTDFPEDAYILYPNYFGICDNNVSKLAEIYKNLIVDNAHSFYSEPKGLAAFNSARKFFKVYNGSYLSIKDLNNMNFKVSSYNNAPYNQTELEKNEILFNSLDIEILNNKTIEQIEAFALNNNRREKFLNLHEKYSKSNLLNIDLSSVSSPFCYPYLAGNDTEAEALVKELTAKSFTIYRYWNKLPQDFNEYKFYARLVPIPLED